MRSRDYCDPQHSPFARSAILCQHLPNHLTGKKRRGGGPILKRRVLEGTGEAVILWCAVLAVAGPTPSVADEDSARECPTEQSTTARAESSSGAGSGVEYGIAAGFHNDVGIESHRAVVLTESFEQATIAGQPVPVVADFLLMRQLRRPLPGMFCHHFSHFRHF